MATVVETGKLSNNALDAAAQFYAVWKHVIDEKAEGGEPLVIVMPSAASDHTDWRKAAARDLARAYAPVRANIVGGDNAERVAAAVQYLSEAPGVTGQYLLLED